MMLHSHTLEPSSNSERGHVVEVLPLRLVNGPGSKQCGDIIAHLLGVEQIVKSVWHEMPQDERDASIAHFFVRELVHWYLLHAHHMRF